MDRLVEFSGGSQNQSMTHGMNVMERGVRGDCTAILGPRLSKGLGEALAKL